MITTEQKFLDPRVLARISNLQLVAKTVVEGFLTGLHRSPHHGVSIEFAEYRPYSPGDEPRSVDWNVFARTDRYYVKKYHGETNTQIHIVLDASGSMNYRSSGISKFEYGSFLAASLAFFAMHQRDAVGLLLFDTEVRHNIPARSRVGQLSWILHALDQARPSKETDFVRPLEALGQFLHRRGIIVLISDFYEEPQRVMDSVRQLQFRGNDIILFHLLDPGERKLDLSEASLLEDMETGERMEVIPEYARQQYRELLEEHIQRLGQESRSTRVDYEVIDTDRPLDFALYSYLSARQRRK